MDTVDVVCMNFSKNLGAIKILGARSMICSRLHTEHLQISGTNVQNLVATAIWRQGFVHLCFR